MRFCPSSVGDSRKWSPSSASTARGSSRSRACVSSSRSCATTLTDAVCVHVFRNPLEVARSVQRRNGFSIAAGVALWEKYNRQALKASGSHATRHGGVRRPDAGSGGRRSIDSWRGCGELGVKRLEVPDESRVPAVHSPDVSPAPGDGEGDRAISHRPIRGRSGIGYEARTCLRRKPREGHFGRGHAAPVRPGVGRSARSGHHAMTESGSWARSWSSIAEALTARENGAGESRR